MTTRFAPAPTGLARPGRTVVVIDDLGELHGPTAGLVELPHRLFWQRSRSVDLGNPALLRWTYETVLREAATLNELRTWLDGPTLITLWPSLFVPRGVRSAWELRHSALRS
ncbi:hypothetical protein [Catelliglobosispora koreensis]|uniref:hypothetical protein n=1 Tax=Catelliglobosispora koreensis TaxID=129052 RepID=UPI00036ED28A|nr:hypothetical protein [Catelliglobosispora koreensis]